MGLSNLLRLQEIFCLFDANLGQRKYFACSTYYQEAARVMEEILLCKSNEPQLVKLCRLQYRQRKVLFSSRIEQSFHNFFSFLPNTMATGTYSAEVKDLCHVWYSRNFIVLFFISLFSVANSKRFFFSFVVFFFLKIPDFPVLSLGKVSKRWVSGTARRNGWASK